MRPRQRSSSRRVWTRGPVDGLGRLGDLTGPTCEPKTRVVRGSSSRHRAAVALVAIFTVVSTIVAGAGSTATAQTGSVTYQEPFRPQFHYTPAQNWMNDPNGLIHHDGRVARVLPEQPPRGHRVGGTCPGATRSPPTCCTGNPGRPPSAAPGRGARLLRQRRARPRRTPAGLAPAGAPARSWRSTPARSSRLAGQSLAHSLDRGRDVDEVRREPRPAPRVGRVPRPQGVLPYEHEGQSLGDGGRRGRRAQRRAVPLGGPPELAPPQQLGPAGAAGGVWECPDLFPLPLDGNPGRRGWVLLVNINPGGTAGGSGASTSSAASTARVQRQERRRLRSARGQSLRGIRGRRLRRLNDYRHRVRQRARERHTSGPAGGVGPPG